MHQVAGLLVERHVLADIEGLDWAGRPESACSAAAGFLVVSITAGSV